MYKTLEEVAARIKALSEQSDLDDDDVKELETLNKLAAKMTAQKGAAIVLESAKAEADAKAKEETAAAIADAVKAERLKYEAAGRRLPMGDVPYQAQYSDEYKFDNLNTTELSLYIETQETFAKAGKMDHVPASALKAMSRRVAALKDNNTENNRQEVAYVKGAFKMGTRSNIEPTVEGVDAAIKAATDPMYTGGTGIGLEWVGTAYSTEIWRVIRAENRIAGKIPSDVIPDGYSSKVWPLESTDMTWYKIAEATASDSTLKVPAATVPATQIATGSKTISVGKMGARGLYTGELTEDSLIAFAPQLRGQLEVSGNEIIESLFIDGDVETSASKNINAIDTTPGATDYYLILDGFRKLALITNTANSRSAGGVLSIKDYKDTMKLMGTAGLAGVDPSKIGFIVDGNVHYANMDLPEVMTRDVAGNAATVFEGFLKKAYGVDIIPSWQMHRASAKRMANNAGKIDADTDSNNTLGAILCVRWDQWKQAYKRRMTMETTRIANADSWEIVALCRLGLAYRDAEASAITYNVGV